MERNTLTADALVPFVPGLSQLLLRRVHLAEEILAAMRSAQVRHVGEGTSLPYRFQFATTIPELDPISGALRERVLILIASLWDKRSWVARHPERFSQSTIGQARNGTYAYVAQRNTPFVQLHAHNALWFGDLLSNGLLRHLEPERDTTSVDRRRSEYARTHGFARGCHTSRPGLLDSSDRWFCNARPGELVFEPAALHRGVLYGAALALLSLLDGLENLELLQVSADRWIEQDAGAGRHSRKQGDTTAAHFAQALLPGGSGTGEVRRLYPISEAAKALLDQIAQELVRARGEIPMVQPGWPMTQRFTSLRAERYLFQSMASSDGTSGILQPLDITVLMRFVLYNTPFSPKAGNWPSTALLRLSAPQASTQQERELKQLREELLAPLAPDLKPSSLQSYQRHLLAYLRYADSAERAYQPETLRQWIADLSASEVNTSYTPDAIDQRATVVRRCMVRAGDLGKLDQERAQEFGAIRVPRHPDGNPVKRGPVPKVKKRVQWLAHLWQKQPTLTHEELRVAYFLEFDEPIGPTMLSAAQTQLHLGDEYHSSSLTAEDEAWIAEQCRFIPTITAQELMERLASERGKRVSAQKLNSVRARLGLRRPHDKPPTSRARPSSSYKLGESDYAWLLQQKRGQPELSAAKLRVALKKLRGKELSERAINTILHKEGLSTGRGRRSQTESGSAEQPESAAIDTEEKPEFSRMPGNNSPSPVIPLRKKRASYRSTRNRRQSTGQPKAASNQLSPEALRWLVKRCQRDPAIANETLQSLLKTLGIRISLIKLEHLRRSLDIPRQE
jgi:transposase